MIDPTPLRTGTYIVKAKVYATIAQAVDFIEFTQNLFGSRVVVCKLEKQKDQNWHLMLIVKED